jgi:hypothetical protein
MALSAELEKLVGLIQDPAEREARRKELTELSDNGLRQAEFSRKMNELDLARKSNEAKHKDNLDWYNRADKQYRTMEADYKAAQERLAALESVKASAEAGGLDQTPAEEAELERQLSAARRELGDANKKIGELDTTVKTFNQMVSDGKIVTLDKFDEEVNKRGDALGAALLDIIDLQDKHRKEYGSDLDRRLLLEEARKRGGNLSQAYEFVTQKAREDKLRRDIEADVEKRHAEKMKNSNLPYAESGEPVIGPLQARLQKRDTGIPDDIPADATGALSSRIAAELRSEGKF